VEDFVSYGFYDLHMHELSPELQEAVRGAPPVHVLAFAVRQLVMGSGRIIGKEPNEKLLALSILPNEGA
jgi:hypothetical protein